MSFRRYIYFITCIVVIFNPFNPGIIEVAGENGNPVITEVAWMGTRASYSDEWIEIYNPTGSPIDISEWSLYGASSGDCLDFSDADGSTTTEIKPYGHLIYSAHQDDLKTESGTNLADIWDSTISLNNSSPGELILYDSADCTGNDVDRINQPEGQWFAGDNSETRTMERVNYCKTGTDPDNWKDNEPKIKNLGVDEDGNDVRGTPGAKNSVYENVPPDPKITGPDECTLGEEIQLNAENSSDCDGYVSSFRWDLNGDGGYDDAIGKSVSPDCSELESDRVSLIITDNGETSSTTSRTILTNRPPKSDFEFSPANPASGEEVKFRSLANDPDGSVISMNWKFGPTGTGHGKSPEYTFPEPGIYSVSLTVSDDSGAEDTMIKEVPVQLALEADAGKNRTLKLGSSLKLRGSVSSSNERSTSVSWELPDRPGKVNSRLDDPGRTNPIFVPDEPGSYRLKLVVTTEGGATASDEITVTVEENPVVDEENFETKFISDSNRTYDGRTKTGLRAKVVEPEDPVRGSIIVYDREKSPEFSTSGASPISFKDLKVTNLENGVVKVSFFYDEQKLPKRRNAEDLGLYYHRPEGGWKLANKVVSLPAENCVTGRVPISDLKGTPITAAVRNSTDNSTVKPEALVTHGPNPVPDQGCIFWFDLPGGVEGGKLKIYAVDGKLLYGTDLSGDQERFPAEGRWNPVDVQGNRLESGLYFYRLKVIKPGNTYWSEVKKLVVE